MSVNLLKVCQLKLRGNQLAVSQLINIFIATKIYIRMERHGVESIHNHTHIHNNSLSVYIL